MNKHNPIFSAFEYLSDFDHYIVANTLKELHNWGSYEAKQNQRDEHKEIMKNFTTFTVIYIQKF